MSGDRSAPFLSLGAFRLFLALALLLTALAAWFVPRVDASGDEPHYLVMAQSLWREHDLDLRDNYAREDWKEFRQGPTEPHYAAPRRDGRPFPGHAPGLPFLIAPVYALGGRLACAMLMSLMVAAVGALAFTAAEREGRSSQAALVTGLAAAGPPLAAFSLHMYTEAPSALALFGAYLALRFGRSAQAAGIAAALACALPFLHPRMAAGAIAVAAAAWLFRERSPLVPFATVAAMGAAVYAAFWMSIFGVPTGLGVYGGAPEDAAFIPGQAFLGLLFDRAYGLLPYAPHFLLLLVFSATLSRRPRGATDIDDANRRAEAVFLAAVLLPVLFWRVWWGGQSPPARLIAPMTPFLALALGRAFDAVTSLWRRLVVAGLSVAWGLFLFAALQPERLLFINRRVRPTRLWDALWPGGPVDGLLPDMARPEASDWPLAFAWAGVLAIAIGAAWWRTRSRGSDAAAV